MRTLVVVFSILLGILLLISALGGSLNSTEKFEDIAQDLVEKDEAETFYSPTATPEEHKAAPQHTTPPTTTPHTTATAEAFRNYDTGATGDVEPYENLDKIPSFAALSA